MQRTAHACNQCLFLNKAVFAHTLHPSTVCHFRRLQRHPFRRDSEVWRANGGVTPKEKSHRPRTNCVLATYYSRIRTMRRKASKCAHFFHEADDRAQPSHTRVPFKIHKTITQVSWKAAHTACPVQFMLQRLGLGSCKKTLWNVVSLVLRQIWTRPNRALLCCFSTISLP